MVAISLVFLSLSPSPTYLEYSNSYVPAYLLLPQPVTKIKLKEINNK
jgi:hypothetical protein